MFTQFLIVGDSKKMRILIVDDDFRTLNSIRVVLTSFGYQIRTVASGSQALEIIKSSMNGDDRVRLLLTDLKMPGMDGLELIRAAREIDPSLWVVLMTAYGDNVIQKKILKLGQSEYIEKPFKPDVLIEKIKTLINRKQNERQG